MGGIVKIWQFYTLMGSFQDESLMGSLSFERDIQTYSSIFWISVMGLKFSWISLGSWVVLVGLKCNGLDMDTWWDNSVFWRTWTLLFWPFGCCSKWGWSCCVFTWSERIYMALICSSWFYLFFWWKKTTNKENYKYDLKMIYKDKFSNISSKIWTQIYELVLQISLLFLTHLVQTTGVFLTDW